MTATEDLELRVKRVESRLDALGVSVDEMYANHRDHTEFAVRLSRLERRVDILEHLLPGAPPVPTGPITSDNVWDTLVPVLQSRVGRVRFNTWFKDLSFVSDDGATLRLRGPNGLYCDFFQHKFASIVHGILAEFGRAGTNLVVRPD